MLAIACRRLSLQHLLVLVLLPLLLQQSHALNVSRTIGDHMVLQRNTPAVIWGFDLPMQRVSTTFLDKTYTTVAGADGIWRQALPPMAEGGPYSIQVMSDTGAVNISDVLFGDVFVCGGQSNMLFSVPAAFNATAEIKNSDYPQIRLFTVGMGTQSDVPLADLHTVEQPWVVSSPSSVANDDWTFFSAICFFFARSLFEELGGSVPIGAINNNWDGSCMEFWVPAEYSLQCNVTAIPAFYNAKIAPYSTGPTAVTGFLWSQGECNANSNTTDYYHCVFPSFIESWRAAFNVPDAFFGFELLPPYISDALYNPCPPPLSIPPKLPHATHPPTPLLQILRAVRATSSAHRRVVQQWHKYV